MEAHVLFNVLSDYGSVLLQGLGTTLRLTSISIVLGLILGFIVSLLRTLSSNRFIYTVCSIYVGILRGTPVLVQLFWFFFCMPVLLGIDLKPFTSAVVSLMLYMSAIASESFRLSMQTINKEQYDACKALGLSRKAEILFVILPQTVIIAIPPLLSNVVTLFKESALVSSLGVAGLLYMGQSLAETTARPIELFSIVAVMYFLVGFILTRMVILGERWLRRRLVM